MSTALGINRTRWGKEVRENITPFFRLLHFMIALEMVRLYFLGVKIKLS
jgi:hypothetical protein